MNIIDKLIEGTIKKKNPSVIGLDPDLSKIPMCYKSVSDSVISDPLAQTAEAIYLFNRDIIDTIYTLIPAVKPQIAFYEKYGSYGMLCFEKTVQYARSKGLVVIEDGKRNDIGNTANAYAQAHLGLVETLTGEKVPSIDADFLTISPFLGSESITPFVDVCRSNNKGIFVLVKTSNSSSGEIQDVKTMSGATVSQKLAAYVEAQAELFTGEYGYSPIGAVVGATYPEEASLLRQIMPSSYFLVPGYGAQGGGARDILPCFNHDGLGAVINSSRGVLYSHMTDEERSTCTKEEYLQSVYKAAKAMQEEIYKTLKEYYTDMVY